MPALCTAFPARTVAAPGTATAVVDAPLSGWTRGLGCKERLSV